MKNLKLKALLVSGLITMGAVTTIPRYAQAQVFASAENSSKFQKEKSAINADAARVQMHRDNLKSLHQKCKEDKVNGNDAAMIENKRAIRKECANLNHAKANLKADKIALVAYHNAAIDARRDEISKDKKELAEKRRQLDNDIARGDEKAASKSAAAVAIYQNEIINGEEGLRRAKTNRNNDILAVNKEIEKANGESIGLFAENSIAKTKNRMEE